MEIIAFYLPQYYTFPENDEWWGKGFTEWTNVKKAKPLYKGHYQPTVPLNNNYYCLDDINVMKWQVELAKQYGIKGFCFYHYWFGENRQLMEKPVNAYLQHEEIDFPFCLSWANHNWSRTWVGGNNEILMDVKYGNEMEWQKHFEYLLPFFKDRRYIKIDGKPCFIIYQPELVENLKTMLHFFYKKAVENGLDGLTFIAQTEYAQYDIIDYYIQYEPLGTFHAFHADKVWSRVMKVNSISHKMAKNLLMMRIRNKIANLTGLDYFKRTIYNYDAFWEYILCRRVDGGNHIAGAFVRFDSSPRRNKKGVVTSGFTVDKFESYLKKLMYKVKNEYNKQIIFMTAWNEWGEGAYLEPDEKYKYQCLEAIKNALESTNGIGGEEVF